MAQILMMVSNTWGFVRPWFVGGRYFFNRGGTTLAASVSFYSLLSIIPFLLLCLRMVGKWIKDVGTFKYHLFNVGKSLFPRVAPDFLNFVEKLVSEHLWAGKKWTMINLTILAFSALSMFNAIWNGVHWLTRQENKNSMGRWFKGFGLILLTVALMVGSLLLPPLLKWGLNFATSNFFVEYMVKMIPPLGDLHTWAKGIKIGRYFFFKSGVISSFAVLFYFTFLYRWFYPLKVKLKYAFMAASTYVILLLGARQLFWVYLKISKKGLVANYGANYTIVIGIMWIFFSSALFFYGICLIEALSDSDKAKSKKKLSVTNSLDALTIKVDPFNLSAPNSNPRQGNEL